MSNPKKVLITFNSNPANEPIIRGWIKYYKSRNINYEFYIFKGNIHKGASLFTVISFIGKLLLTSYDFVFASDIYSAFWASFVCKIRGK